MSDPDTPDTGQQPPDDGQRVLGRIAPGAYDAGLRQPAAQEPLPPLRMPPPPERPAERRSHRRPASDERTGLPRGALAALHRSGGIVFRTSSVTVYRDGRVTYDADGPGGARAQAVWLLTDDELAELRRQIAEVDWDALSFAHAPPSPDAYSYELLARDGRRLRRLETAEGAIPQAVEPLLRRLAAYGNAER